MPQKTEQRCLLSYYEFLIQQRLAKGMSKADVVRASKLPDRPDSAIAFPLLSKVENGRILEPRMSTAVKLARGYGVSITELASYF